MLNTSKFFETVSPKSKEPEVSEEELAARVARLQAEREEKDRKKREDWFNRQMNEFVTLPVDYVVKTSKFTEMTIQMAHHPLFNEASAETIRKAVSANPLRFDNRRVREYILKIGDFEFGNIFLETLGCIQPTDEVLENNHPTVYIIMAVLNAYGVAVDVNGDKPSLMDEAKDGVRAISEYILRSFPRLPEWCRNLLKVVARTGYLKAREEKFGPLPEFHFRKLWERPDPEVVAEQERQAEIARIQALPDPAIENVKTTKKTKKVSPGRDKWEADKKAQRIAKKSAASVQSFEGLGELKGNFPKASKNGHHAENETASI
ncbi:MAG: hypothetical protein ACYCZW_00325 [Minisyncoccota bacterium]